MLGFSPVGDEAARDAGPHLLAVDASTRRVRPAPPRGGRVGGGEGGRIEWVREGGWRRSGRRGRRGGTLTDDEVADFVDRSAGVSGVLPGLYGDGPFGSQPGKVLTVRVDRGRNVLDV